MLEAYSKDCEKPMRKRGELGKQASEESGEQNNREGAVGIRKLISITTRKKKETHPRDSKHVAFENLQKFEI